MAMLDIDRWGSGDPVVLVHGSLLDGPTTWRAQRALTQTGPWSLFVVQRRGYGASPPANGDDFLVDGQDLAELLTEPAHIVAHSYGALGALLMAGAEPANVRSLTLVEPPAYSAARGIEEVDTALARFAAWCETAPEDPNAFYAGWAEQLGLGIPGPKRLPSGMEDAIRLVYNGRRPWTAQLPLAAVRAAGIPTLVISGGHSPVFERICDALADKLGAERTVITGRGHLIPLTGGPFNAALERFLVSSIGRELKLTRS